MSNKKIVHEITPDIDPRSVLCTTYQMRNTFRQFYDGVASELEVYSYFLHQAAAELCPKQGRVLDVCSGRGLLIPFLRYHASPSLYVGVDISPKNATWSRGVDPRRGGKELKEWGFKTVYVESNAATMVDPVQNAIGVGKLFDLVVYTASIEHMQPSDQKKSLVACNQLCTPKGQMYLTFPVTHGVSGYDTQYKAHVYEPSMPEIHEWLSVAGWKVVRRFGWLVKTHSFRKRLDPKRLKTAEYIYSMMPRPLALVMVAALFPDVADEVALLCVKR